MGSMERMSNTEEETEHVRAYYKVINPLLAIADIEKMYIPPQIDPKKGLYENQLIWERMVKDSLQLGKESKLLDEIDHAAKELFRVLKPGGRYSCGEYLLSPQFDRNDKEHMALHRLFLPTLAATQSNYPEEVTSALQRAGFDIIQSAPSIAPAWPLTDQKTDLFHGMRFVVNCAVKVGFLPEWIIDLIDNLLKGGIAWADAEKMKIADLNWRIVAQKPK